MTNFYIKAITIGESTNSAQMLHNLVPGRYELRMDEALSLYGRNISVSAIVGCNGAGKTSLLEMMFRILNNFSYLLLSRNYLDINNQLQYIPNVHGTIEYSTNGKECQLICEDDIMRLVEPDNQYVWHYDSENECSDETSSSQKNLKPIASTFFYTIAKNYSLMSLSNYDYQDVALKDRHGKRQDESNQWSDNLGYLNEAYLFPINIGPIRVGGRVDMEKEYRRINDCLCALLLQTKYLKKELLEGYQLLDIRCQYDKIFEVYKKIMLTYPPETEKENAIFSELSLSSDNDQDYPTTGYLALIHNHYALEYKGDDPTFFQSTLLYLGYVLFDTISRNPAYGEYAVLGTPWMVLAAPDSEVDKQLFLKLLYTLDKDKSSGSIEYRRALNLLKLVSDGHVVSGSFSFEDYLRWTGVDERKTLSVDQFMALLPPAIVQKEIILQKTCGTSSAFHKQSSIKFCDLSSGEKQLLFYMSTILYHVLYVKSLSIKGMSYRNFNIVLDEIEMCFHPELQRTFIYKLVHTIQRLCLNTSCSFNFILTTHSPFILSDIPDSNILYLSDGKPLTGIDRPKQPFAANVNNILRDNFFLNHGFMGEVAKEQILSLVSYLKHDKQGDWNPQKAESFIRTIGDDFLREQLTNLFLEIR